MVRATCKYFRDLVDNSDLFRDWPVELTEDQYEEDFWRTLRRWRVTVAVIYSPHSWAHIAQQLPGLTTLIESSGSVDVDIKDLNSFTNLQHCSLKLNRNVRFEEFSLLPARLTHLKLCLKIDTNALPSEISSDSPMKKLKSLASHCDFDVHPVNILHFLLSSLPQLQHLSLSVFSHTPYNGNISDLPPLHNCSLSSLELLWCESMNLPLDFMKMLSPLSFLRSLAIFCTSEGDGNDQSLKLSTWLRDLPTITSLMVECERVGGFIRCIPSSVSRLILLPYYFDAQDMTVLSAQLPNLNHLQLEVEAHIVNPDLGPVSGMALIPQLFPKLKTLRLIYQQVSEDTFLNLASLKELEVLEVLDAELPPNTLLSKFRERTNYKVHIYKTPERPWLQSCCSARCIPTEYWA